MDQLSVTSDLGIKVTQVELEDGTLLTLVLVPSDDIETIGEVVWETRYEYADA